MDGNSNRKAAQMSARLPNSAHMSRAWKVHEITRDFRVEDVWELPTPGGPGDFPLLVEGIAAGVAGEGNAAPAKALWAIRWKLGEIFGWDDQDEGLGGRVASLRERMPGDLLAAPTGPAFDSLPFSSLYQLEDEWAAEIANKTVHGVMHIGWVEDGSGGYRGQMAVLVRPNGLMGELYMAAIKPFRHLLVYPQMLRQIDSTWRRGMAAASGAPA